MIAEIQLYDREVDSLTDDPGPVVRVRRVRVESARFDEETNSWEVEASE